ncbi:MAG: hypothetical protein LBE82_12660 [Chitinophagaceae bacterium]|nr:hypothetical protein [Chitinophagaceae bacterium]
MWNYAYQSETSEVGNFADTSNDLPNFDISKLTPQLSFIDIQTNGTFTSYFTKFDYGKWEKKAGFLILKSHTGISKEFNIQLLSTNNLVLKEKESASAEFTSTNNSFKNENENPYAVNNNLWRIRATHKETDLEIRARLCNYFKYWETYFRWGEAKGKQSLDVRSLQGALKIYGNGFELLPPEKVSPNWIHYFYDEDDYEKSQKIISDIFHNENISWLNTNNKFDMFISAFQQLQRFTCSNKN